MKSNFTLALISAIFMVASAPAFSFTYASSPEYKAKVEQAEEQGLSARKACEDLSEPHKLICITEAESHEERLKADARADEIDNPKARAEALIKHASADFELAKAKCQALEGNPKEVCIKRAALVHEERINIAKVNLKSEEAEREAVAKIKSAEYQLELKRCDAYKGSEQATCIKRVKDVFRSNQQKETVSQN
jgi:hypothetical protein